MVENKSGPDRLEYIAERDIIKDKEWILRKTVEKIFNYLLSLRNTIQPSRKCLDISRYYGTDTLVV